MSKRIKEDAISRRVVPIGVNLRDEQVVNAVVKWPGKIAALKVS
jgi:hypothetical protein